MSEQAVNTKASPAKDENQNKDTPVGPKAVKFSEKV